MRRDEAFLAASSLLLPRDERAVHRERWAADLRDASDVGLTRGAVLRGVAIFALRHFIQTLPGRLGRHRSVAAAARLLVGGSVVAALLDGLETIGTRSLGLGSAPWLLTAWGEVALWCVLAALAASLVRRWGEGAVILFAALAVALFAQAAQAIRFDAPLSPLQVVQGVLFLSAEVLFLVERAGSERQASTTTTSE